MAKKSLKQAVEEIKKEVVAEVVPVKEMPPLVDYVKLAETQIRAAFAVRQVSTVSQKNSFASALAMDLYKKGLLKG